MVSPRRQSFFDAMANLEDYLAGNAPYVEGYPPLPSREQQADGSPDRDYDDEEGVGSMAREGPSYTGEEIGATLASIQRSPSLDADESPLWDYYDEDGVGHVVVDGPSRNLEIEALLRSRNGPREAGEEPTPQQQADGSPLPDYVDEEDFQSDDCEPTDFVGDAFEGLGGHYQGDDYDSEHEDRDAPSERHASPSVNFLSYSPRQRRNTTGSRPKLSSATAQARTHTRFDTNTRSPRLLNRSRSASRCPVYGQLEPDSRLYEPAMLPFDAASLHDRSNDTRYSPNSPQMARGTLLSARRGPKPGRHLAGLGISSPTGQDGNQDDVRAEVRGRRSHASQEELEAQEVRSASIERRRRSTEQREREVEERRASVWAEAMAGPYRGQRSVSSTPSPQKSARSSPHTPPRRPRKTDVEQSYARSPRSPSQRATDNAKIKARMPKSQTSSARLQATLAEAKRFRDRIAESQKVAYATRAQREARETQFAANRSPSILKSARSSVAQSPVSRSSARSSATLPGAPRSARSSVGPPPLRRRLFQTADRSSSPSARTEADRAALQDQVAALRAQVAGLVNHVQGLEAELEAVRGEDALMSGALPAGEADEVVETEEGEAIEAPVKKTKKSPAKSTKKKAPVKSSPKEKAPTKSRPKKTAKRKADAVDAAESEASAPAPKKARKAAAKKQATSTTAAAEEPVTTRRSSRIRGKGK